METKTVIWSNHAASLDCNGCRRQEDYDKSIKLFESLSLHLYPVNSSQKPKQSWNNQTRQKVSMHKMNVEFRDNDNTNRYHS